MIPPHQMDFKSTQEMVDYVVQDVTEQAERTIFQQFMNLVRDGVVEIKRTVPIVTVVQNPLAPESEMFRMSQYVELTWKGEEVLERQKRQIQELEAKLRAISLAVKQVGE